MRKIQVCLHWEFSWAVFNYCRSFFTQRMSVSSLFEMGRWVYNTVMVPTLIYGSEMWTTYCWHPKSLERFHQRCLWSILNISWNDYWTNISVLSDNLYLIHHRQKNPKQRHWACPNVRQSLTQTDLQFWTTAREKNKKRSKETLQRHLEAEPQVMQHWLDQLGRVRQTGGHPLVRGSST